MSHFIRILIGEWRVKLPIPKLFVSSFSLTPKTVKFINTSKRVWIVDMEKEEEDPKQLYFKKNWPTFVEDNALEAADFLIFKFDGNSTFKVVVCGKSACDKTLESHNRPEASNQYHRENWKGKDVIDLEIKEDRVDFDDFGTCSQEMWNETWSSESYEDEEEYEESDHPDDIGEGTNLGSMHPSFTVQLLASAKKGCMCIPTEFLNKHMEKKRQEVEIETVKGVWTVTLLPHKKGARTFARFSKGWSQFARNNHFKTGQTLLFKMVRTGHRPKFVVHEHEQENASSS